MLLPGGGDPVVLCDPEGRLYAEMADYTRRDAGVTVKTGADPHSSHSPLGAHPLGLAEGNTMIRADRRIDALHLTPHVPGRTFISRTAISGLMEAICTRPGRAAPSVKTLFCCRGLVYRARRKGGASRHESLLIVVAGLSTPGLHRIGDLVMLSWFERGQDHTVHPG